MTFSARARRHWPALVPITLSAVLSSWALGTVGWGNTYYSAAVRSMSRSWHAFWFGSLDSAGFVTVDKPPFSLWVQSLVVRVVGFHQLAILVPQVVAGVASVALVYAMVLPRWGRVAAVTGAAALAVTPIAVMVNHSNNTDSILVLMMTATLFAVVRAVERGGWGWWIASALFFGAAFTTKMMAAAPVLPAMLVAFALGSRLAVGRRVVMLGVGGLLAVVSALAWFTFVDLTPESSRPYVGSSATNSAYQLAFERNGVNQVEGGEGTGGLPSGPGQGRPGRMPGGPGYGPPGMGEPPPGVGGGSPRDGGSRPSGGAGAGGMQPPGFSGGQSGLLRLFNADLGTQIGWLIVPALGGLATAVAVRRRGVLGDPVVVGATLWFVAGAAVFSVTKGIVHPYYMAGLAPPLAILVGVGAGVARERACGGAPSWRDQATLGATVALCGIVSWVIARRENWSLATGLALATVVLGLMVALVARSMPPSAKRWLMLAPATVLLVPAAWTAGSLKAGLNANLPYAHPVSNGADRFGVRPGLQSDLQSSDQPSPSPGGSPVGSVSSSVIEYLVANRGTATWIVATPSAMSASPMIIATGEAVMAFGGFSGNDPILTNEEFDRLVADGAVRFVMLTGGPGGGASGGPGGASTANGADGQGSLQSHVTDSCAQVAEVSASLYDCASS